MLKPIFSFKRYHTSNISFLMILVLAILFFSQLSIVFAYGVLTLDVNILDDPTSAETGEILTYIIDFSCGGVTTDCGTLSIDFGLDPDTEFVEVITSTGYTASQVGGVVTIIDQDGDFEDGDASQVVVRVRVRHDLLGGETITPTLEGTISLGPPDDTPETYTQGVPTVTVTAPTEQWSVNKLQTYPPSIGPAEDGIASYSVQFCSDSSTGNISLNNAQLVDTFPTGALVVANPQGGTVTAGPPPQISWALGTLDIETIGNTCVTRNYTLQYPVGIFPEGSSIANSVEGFGDNPNFPTTGPCGTNCVGDSSTNGTIDPPTVNPSTGKTGPGTAFVSPGGGFSDFFLNFNLNNANFPAENVIFTDTLPLAPSDSIPSISVMQIQSGEWDGGFPAVVEWRNAGGTWTPIATVDGSANTIWLSGAANDFPGPEQNFSTNATTNIIYGIRWRFTDPELPAGFSMTSSPVVSFIPREGMAAGDYDNGGIGFRDYSNCVSVNYAVDGGAPTNSPNTCANVRLSEDPQGYANINFFKADSPGQVDVLQPLTFTLTVELTQEASGDLINPTIIDVIPDYLDYNPADGFTVTFTNVPGSEQIQPYLFVDNVTNAPDTRLVFYWDNNPPIPGSITSTGAAAAGANNWTLTEPASGLRRVQIVFTVIPNLTAPAGVWANDISIVSDSPNLFCQTGTPDADAGDIDNDSNFSEVSCGTSTDYAIREAAQMISSKWIRTLAGPTTFRDSNNLSNPSPSCPTLAFGGNLFTRFPCVAQGVQGGDFETLLRIENTGLTGTDNYILYDVLPHIGDTGVSQATSTQARLTEFDSVMTGPIVIASLPAGLGAGDFTIEYSTAPGYNGCRTEMSNNTDEVSDWQGGCVDDWVGAGGIGNWADVTSFRIIQNNGQINANGVLLFTVPMRIPAYVDGGTAETGEITWNQFAQRFSNAGSGTRLLTAEPRKVGIVVVQEFSIGNIVFADTGVGGGRANDGLRNGTEAGIANVTMQLFIDTNNNGAFNAGTDTLVNTDVTDANGFYLFESDSGGNPLVEGARYFVRIAPAEFDAGGDLIEYVGSTPQFTNNTDRNDNGNNGASGAGVVPGAIPNYPTLGIVSNGIVLTRNALPINETELSNNPLDGPFFRGNRFQEDRDSNLTIDFGVFKPHSIGNRVWFDDGAGGGVQNNGIIDGTEVGIDGVLVELFIDTNNNGIVEPNGADGAPFASTTTANGGYYLFDLLAPDQYIVHIASSNFAFGTTPATDGPLSHYITSTGNSGDTETDNNDNGIDPASEGDQRANGVFSVQIELEMDGETTAEAPADKDASLAQPDGRRTDFDSSELTVDFGFFEEITEMSLGNRVWYDNNNNGTLDGTETGINGVTVLLYFDDNSDGIPDDNGAPGLADDLLATDTTDANGFYLFDNLNPGRYIVHIPPSNWTGGTLPLENFFSSTPTDNTENTDNNDNGINQPDYVSQTTNGILSTTIQLVPQGEPLADDDTGSGTGNAEDNNSDNTVDFGFYKRMSLGNLVWIDDATTNGAQPGDGIFQPAEGEAGVDGIRVELYEDNGDGIFNSATDTFIGFDTTANGGFYLFEDLSQRNYFVHIPASNFDTNTDPLFIHYSSDGVDGNNGDDIGDDDDNGVEVALPNPAADGVTSALVVLIRDGEPDGETRKEAGVLDGANVEFDNSDLTKDFGFFIPPMSIGNRVWFDRDRDGLLEPASETPLDNITMFLYEDDGDGIFEPGGDDGAPIQTNVTHDGGYYIFTDLVPGNYFVQIDPNEFATGELQDFISTTTGGLDEATNYDDNGIDPASFADYATAGVVSNVINLAHRAEPTTDNPADDLNPGGLLEGVTGRGANDEDDDDSNLSIDFGLFMPFSIGNNVWRDNGQGGGARLDGIKNGTEAGIANVTVSLYRDTGDNTFDRLIDTSFGTTTTDANGYYIFDNLPEGTYFVWINDTNFQAGGNLLLFDGSPGNGVDNQTDIDDNGIDDDFPATNGIVSSPIVLSLGTEPVAGPTAEHDPSNNAADHGPNFRGLSDPDDDNSDLTIDFGFDVPRMSLGNRVWFDTDNSGVADLADIPYGANPTIGISGVRVDLYLDANNDSIAQVGEIIRSDTTDANGYYLFDDLAPGFYFVGLNELNFRTGFVLEDLYSSTGNTGDTQTDIDDNGIDDATPETGGIISPRIELGSSTTRNTEPTGETDLSNNPLDGAPGFRGNTDELDSNSDLTIDFGLYKPMSIGNRVWFDPDLNGLIDFGTESGIAGVTLDLYRDDGDGIFDSSLDTLIDTDTTDGEGFYLFDDPLLMEPGNYFVYVPPPNFTAGALLNLTSTTTIGAGDNNDNGVDDPDPSTNGIVSNLITLAVDGQPTGESNLSNSVADGPNRIGNNGQTDENSDITIDFGFAGAQMSLGNRVWLDPNNNALIDFGTEAGIAGVTVTLYRDTDADGIPNGAAIGTDTTDANGYYLFGNLTPGNYVVAVGNSNFLAGAPLAGLISSTGNGVDDQTDSDDNGIDTLNATYGLLSSTINLALDSEIDTEADLGPEGDGPNSETPVNSELTIDFGLYRPMSIGNRVWLDTDNDGRIDTGEAGIGNILVNLYRDDNNDGLIDPTELIGTTTTDPNGFYIFDGLGQGNYIVEIPPTNFTGAGGLIGLNSSTNHLTTDADSRDKGIDDADPATNGILSSVFTLTNNTEPTNDTNLGPEGHGSNGETNSNSNLSVDFGFFGLPMSLGNRVWIDDGAGGGVARDGIKDAGELGVQGVRVSLYRDSDQDGVPDGAAIATDTTNTDGYYLFDGLQAGFYLVGIDANNFTGTRPLSGFSSTTTLAPDTDNNDNGIDNNNPGVNGIFSDTVQLQPDTEPLTEEEGPEGRGANGETDPNSNLTVDFGFYKPMSIGNRVWFDPDDNGLIDASEVGIAGVTVTLYQDDGDGIFDSSLDTPIGNDTTDSNGYYLFDNLDPGDYIVVVDDTNFTAGVLQGFASSTGATANATDRNDNGIDTPTPVGIASNVISLTQNGAPTNDNDTSGNTDDGPNFRGNNGESNNNSDLSIDFGFVAGVMSIGNRVWFDTNDNGIIDTGELGVEGVIVNLYPDVDQDGVPDGTFIQTDTTDANGYYIFDGLPPGSYVVQVTPINFRSGGALESLFSSSITNNNVGVDNNDNGIDDPNPSLNGIFSETVILVADNAPTTEDPADYGPEGNGSNGETDENSDLTIDFGFATRFDLGDAPDSYQTLVGSGGPQHQIVTNLYLGEVVDDEDDGQPNAGADGDDNNGTSADDEDGVNIPTLIAGTTIDLDFTVFNDTGVIATLIAWFDFNGDGDFDTNESFNTTVPSSSSEQVIPLTILVPISADQTTGGSTYARIRLTTDTLTASDVGGVASDGEIEDYVVTIDPPGIAMTKSDGNNSLVVGTETTYTITINNSGVDVFNRNFVDNLPTGDPNGFIASSISWTCTATGGASCISGQPAGTDDSGTGNINTFIDIPRNGTIVYELTATLNEDYNDTEVINVAELISGTQVEDVNGIIYDPPSGVKSGVALDDTHIRWTMVWLNTGGPQAATITDTLPNSQTFDGNLSCDAFGTSVTNSCTFNGSDVIWTGTIGTGNSNRVEIAFDVRVAGNATYRNVAEIDIGGSTATASGRVSVGDGSGDDDDDSDPGSDNGGGNPNILAPALTKSVDTPFTLPGSTVTWTIQAINDTDQTINNVVVTDNVPDTLEILSGNSSSGDLEINGQTVTVRQASLAPGETITITLQTRVSRDIGLPFVVNNPATLTCDCSEARDAIATIISVLELPATGQSPYSGWRFIIPIMVIGLAGLGWTVYRRRSFSKSQ